VDKNIDATPQQQMRNKQKTKHNPKYKQSCGSHKKLSTTQKEKTKTTKNFLIIRN
jgi:hypothetical protein